MFFRTLDSRTENFDLPKCNEFKNPYEIKSVLITELRFSGNAKAGFSISVSGKKCDAMYANEFIIISINIILYSYH